MTSWYDDVVPGMLRRCVFDLPYACMHWCVNTRVVPSSAAQTWYEGEKSDGSGRGWRGSQDLTRRLTWGWWLSAKLNETTILRPHISRTKRTDNMKFSTRIQKNILSQHAKRGYSRENIVLLSVVLTWHLGTCISTKNACLIKRRGLSFIQFSR